MKKYLYIVLLVFFWSCEDKFELPYKNLRSINIAYIQFDSDFINEDSYYISSEDSLGNFLTNQLLNTDTNLIANTYLPNLCHHIHYYEQDGIVIYSKYLGNPTADAYTVTLNLNLREKNSEKFLVSYEIR
tara:strand:+ start:375 stop:764 length:390 start_codon:yes stop_codon:yes gene_type:complete